MAVRIIRNWWWVDFRHEGRRYRIRSPENSRAGAKAYEAVVAHRLTNGELATPPAPAPPRVVMRFAAFSRYWFDTYVRTSNKPSSQRSRAHMLRNHLVPAFGGIALNEIATRHVEAYKAEKIRGGLSPKTVNEHLGILSKCLRDARDWDVPVGNLNIRRLRAPKPSYHFLSRPDAARLLAAFRSDRWRAMATLALHTGLRVGELFGLRWEDIDLESGLLSVRQSVVRGIIGTPKSDRERHVPLDAQATAALSAVPRSGTFVFHREDGRPLALSTAEGALRRACARAGLRVIGWHVLRHTYASWLAATGTPVPAIQQLLGHSTIEMTMRYAHLAPSALRDAAAALQRYATASTSEFFGQQVGNAPWITPVGNKLPTHAAPAPVAQPQRKTTLEDHGRFPCG